MDHGTKRAVKGLGSIEMHDMGCDNWETDDNGKGGKGKLPRIVRRTTLIVRIFESVGISTGRIPHVGGFKHANETGNSTITSRGGTGSPASLLIH